MNNKIVKMLGKTKRQVNKTQLSNKCKNYFNNN